MTTISTLEFFALVGEYYEKHLEYCQKTGKIPSQEDSIWVFGMGGTFCKLDRALITLISHVRISSYETLPRHNIIKPIDWLNKLLKENNNIYVSCGEYFLEGYDDEGNRILISLTI